MKKKVMQFIAENRIFATAKSLALAVSGGADSMSLAHFMVKNYPQYDYVIAHINHGLRGEAQSEEELVKAFAYSLGIEFVGITVDVADEARARNKGIEETGREIRYDFLRSLNRDLILTGHHLNDRSETILAHLIRGTGIRGLRGIMPLENGIARPFLGITRTEILDYCQKNEIIYANDASNADTIYQRNKIRHEVLPLLATMNPNIDETLCRLGDIATEEEAVLKTLTDDFCVSNVKNVKNDGQFFTLANSAVEATARGIVRRAVAQIGEGLDNPLDFLAVESILQLKTGKKYCWGENAVAEQTGKALLFSVGDREIVESWSNVLNFPGVTVIDNCSFSVDISTLTNEKRNKNNCAVFDKGDLIGDLTLRNWQKGDWFSLPEGGRKKLSDYFIDNKIPQNQRYQIPLIAMGSKILWIIGYRQCLAIGEGNIEIKIKCLNKQEKHL